MQEQHQAQFCSPTPPIVQPTMTQKTTLEPSAKSVLLHPITLGIALRVVFFFYGLYQDAHLAVKYTDIDYVVFSDAAEYVFNSESPYRRVTYRYTPLLAWMLVPNAMGDLFYHYGKLLFVLCDILTGVLITRLIPDTTKTLKLWRFSANKKTVLLSIWLLNPIVITISTRGSSESVLTFLILISLTSLLKEQYFESAVWLGVSIHFKIYPVIYLPSFLYFLAHKKPPFGVFKNVPVLNWLNATNVVYLAVTLASFAACGVVMYSIYGPEFVYHSYLYHLTRLDHRHNFSVYNLALYYKSAAEHMHLPQETGAKAILHVLAGNMERFAFVPQLALSAVLIPLALAQSHLLSCLFIQTLAFVTFNKVMTSQYFIWFLIFLPSYLASSKLLTQKYAAKGVAMVALWIVSQASWLYFAYNLEFLGKSTFDGGLFYLSIFFFLTNCWIIGQTIELV